MNVQLHAFETDAWPRIRGEYDQAIGARLQWLSEGRGDVQAICRQLVHFSIWSGCATLILSHEDADAIRYFEQAQAHGLLSLGAPGSTKGLRVFDVLLERSDAGTRLIYEHEVRALQQPRMLSVADFSSVLTLVACFGERDAMEAVARYSEDRYRNPNVIASEDYYGYLAAWKQLFLGKDKEALQLMRKALDARPKPEPRKDMEAFMHLLEGDRARFLKLLEDRVRAHKKRYEKEPANPEGYICFPALMLSRMALDRGVPVSDGPYVPMRLLPNYRPVVH